MASADFSVYRNTESNPRSPLVRACSCGQCLRHLHINPLIFGRYKDVVAYPDCYASYAVSVRQYRPLQSRFLQCLPRSRPPCGLLTVRGVTPARKGLPVRTDVHPGGPPSGKFIAQLLRPLKFICIFNLFIKLPECVQCMLMQGTHKKYSACRN